ncbi:hypothetical protein [Luteimonas saliphila]|uniref:hypothetical protein n=1 Tax=Luteimonas saliphila TaxID=2804919 RepID=UPI00192D76B1|nr:hypothetical protein [Luteimonas saliphila]
MTEYANPGVSKNVRASEDAGQLTYNRFTFDFAASYAPATFTNASSDRIQVGEVPAGEVLVPHLCRMDIPELDTAGSPTGDYSLGIAGAAASLRASAASETPVVLTGEDFLVPATPIGARDVPTPIYLSAVAAHATIAATGVLVFEQVTRPYDVTIDG